MLASCSRHASNAALPARSMPVPVEPESTHFESVCQASFFKTYNLSRVGRLSGSVLMEIGQLASVQLSALGPVYRIISVAFLILYVAPITRNAWTAKWVRRLRPPADTAEQAVAGGCLS
jgi:hypothetical protein